MDRDTARPHALWARIGMAAMAVCLSGAPAWAATPQPRQYTFAWPYVDGEAMAPRGGMTEGPEVALVAAPSPAWTRLREPGLDSLERDRRAILAMAGDYRASFEFIEVAGFTPDFAPDRPYRNWGTERIYVLADEPGFISLQHILVIRVRNADGSLQPPMVTKHWRQDWTYEPTDQLVYRGPHRWETVSVRSADARGAWRQSVWQVDDSPRYSGVGRWQHAGNYSSWTGEEGWRPLPRREYTARNDYQVLIGTNRHTITPTGWVHEQQNNKVVLVDGRPDPAAPVLAREFGFNRYQLIRNFDFSPADQYWDRSAPMWAAVRQTWEQIAATQRSFALHTAADQGRLYAPLFERAAELGEAPKPPVGQALEQVRLDAERVVRSYLLPAGTAVGTSPAVAPPTTGKTAPGRY